MTVGFHVASSVSPLRRWVLTSDLRPPLYSRGMAAQKTFYLETFGCQMNVHDSEKVIGTLEQQGYARVERRQAPT